MELWTEQGKDLVNVLASGATVSCDRAKASYRSLQPFRDAYDWIAGVMAEKLNDPPPFEGAWPLWAWAKYDGKPTCDLRMFRHARTEESRDNLWLKLEIPADRVLLTGFDAWHSVLNGFPGGAPAGPDPSDEDWDAYLSRDWSKEELRDTWLHCLSLSGERSIQASFWQLRPEDVTKVFLNGRWRPLEAVAEG